MIKTPSQIAKMRHAGSVVANILMHLRQIAQQPNMNGVKLNQIAHEMILAAGCKPNFLNYHGFPAVLCVSINDELVHGIPKAHHFQPGDLISLDLGCSYQNWHADAALSFTIGKPNLEIMRLIDTTRNSLNLVIKKIKPGMKINQIGCIIEKYITERGYCLTAQYTGHGIGKQLHEFPPIWNICRAKPDLILQPGMVLCIEPMVLIDSPTTYVAKDGWTVKSVNKKLNCHFEKMVLITETGTEILTNYAD